MRDEEHDSDDGEEVFGSSLAYLRVLRFGEYIRAELSAAAIVRTIDLKKQDVLLYSCLVTVD